MLPSPWTVPLDPLLLVAVVLVCALVVVSLRSTRGERGAWRRSAGPAGALLLAAAWLSPLQTVASHYLLTAHLFQITLVMGVVPPLLLLGLPGHIALRVPTLLLRAGAAAVHPLTGMVTVNVVFFAWHLTSAYDASLRSPVLYSVQQLSLLIASVPFWWPIVVPMGHRVLSRWATLGYILVATIPQTFGGITVALARHALYPTYGAAPRLFGLGVMADQEIAGACIALVSKLALFTAFAVIFMHMLSEPAPDNNDDDDGGGGGGGRRPGADRPSPQPSGSVPWLAHLNSGRTVAEPAPAPRRIRVPARAGSRRD